MTSASPTAPRVSLDGKFFRLGSEKFFVKGLSYGPFAANAEGEPWPNRETVQRDFAQVRDLGANVLRVYMVPPAWVLDLAAAHGLRLLIDVPWPVHLCFLDSRASAEGVRRTVVDAVQQCRGHAAVFAFSLANEIPADIVRWSGARAVSEFIDELVEAARAAAPEHLYTYTSFPPTEFLAPQTLDFVSFNVYLHHSRAFESYLARLQMLANDKPLLLAEFGLDSLREGEARQAELLAEQIDGAFRAGAAGAIVFSFTDDWVRCDQPVLDWAFGVTTRERVPKRAFAAVREAYRRVPPVFGAKPPKVSVVVACYNGASTLPLCLDSLLHLNYPDYEVILVDDGSTDATAQIAGRFPSVRLVQIPHQGLSAARNAGIAAATGAIVAFTDADCRADEDWLRYLVDDLLRSDFVGMGGPNFLPPDDSLVAAAVMVSPGGPAPVMLTDRVAEHLPGCNLAFYKWALEDIGGFDPMFKRAGDDVDICWRLQERGYRLGYSPAAFVWHYRRSTVGAYLKQQSGYGEAEALLARKHPEYFNALGASIWRGRIYAPAQTGVFLRRPVVYHGVFGSALFQRLYAPEPAAWSGLFTSLEYHGLVTAPLLVLAASFRPLLLVALASLLVSLGVCGLAGAQADLPKRKRRWWSRPLVALLFLLQPLARGWARYRWRLQARSAPVLLAVSTPAEAEPVEKLHYWSQSGLDRIQFLQALLATLDTQAWQHKVDAGWSDHDVEIFGSRWSRLRLTTVGEAFRPYQLILRCRLQAAWSFWARLVFAALLGAELLVIGFFSAAQPWLWMLLLSLVLFGWYLDQAKRVMQQAIATLLDSVAQQLGLVKLREDGESGQLKPVDAPPLPAPKSAAPPLVRVVTPQVQGDSQEPVSKR